jgi:hypothetical protein
MDILDDNDRKSPVWQKIESYLKEELQALRERNDIPMYPDKTADIRGEIKAIKKLLSKTKEKPNHNASGTNYT